MLVMMALIAGVSAGCAHYFVNPALDSYSAAQGYRFNPESSGNNTNSLFVCLTFSGGGTRAAALSYGVLEALRNARIRWKGIEKSLLDEVDCISSVSGGSFAAAYYGLYGDRIFAEFPALFLERDVQGELTTLALNPYNVVRLASPTFSRIDLAAEHYDRVLFGGKPLGAIAEHGPRPFVIINATNLSNGERFEFTQDEFDFIGSKAAAYPISRAVAASSAFPLFLSPVTLQNHPEPPDFTVPADVSNGLEDYDVNRRRYQWARTRSSYLDKAARPYLHLMDGGVADNIGLRAIESAWRRSSGFIRRLINDGEIEKFVVIVVNARTEGQDSLSRDESPPGIGTVAYKTATIALGNYSFESIELIKELGAARLSAQQTVAACQQLLRQCPDPPQLPPFAANIEPYVVELNFESIPDAERRDYFLRLPTTFRLSHEQVQSLRDVAPELLNCAPAYGELMESLGSAASCTRH
jgi:predicted acylesterase/phospholipase RssA